MSASCDCTTYTDPVVNYRQTFSGNTGTHPGGDQLPKRTLCGLGLRQTASSIRLCGRCRGRTLVGKRKRHEQRRHPNWSRLEYFYNQALPKGSCLWPASPSPSSMIRAGLKEMSIVPRTGRELARSSAGDHRPRLMKVFDRLTSGVRRTYILSSTDYLRLRRTATHPVTKDDSWC